MLNKLDLKVILILIIYNMVVNGVKLKLLALVTSGSG